MDADVARLAQQFMHDRAMYHLEPARAHGFADDDLGRVVLPRIGKHVVGDALARQSNRVSAELLGQPQGLGDAIPFGLAQPLMPRCLDIERRPGSAKAVGDALGMAHELQRARLFTDADKQALAGRPGPGDGVLLHIVQHLLVDTLGGPPQRQLTQGREISGREIVLERALRLVGHIDLALAQPLNQIIGRQVDDFDLRAVYDPVGHGFAHPHPRDLGDDIVQALQMLDIDCRVDVNAGAEQFFDIQIAFRMPRSRRIAVRQLVDEDQRRPARQDGVDIHLREFAALIGDAAPRDCLQAFEQCFGFLAAMGFDNANDDIDTHRPSAAGGLEHLVSLADAWRRTQENPKLAPFSPGGGRQQGVRRRS